MTENTTLISSADSFVSAKLKVQWANAHIHQLNAILQRLPDEDMCRVGIEHDAERGVYSVKVEGAKYILADFPLLVGDIVHNLRSALDHTATAIVGRDSTSVYFPFHERKEKFISCPKVRAIDQACPGLGQYIAAELEPYKDGRSGLWPITKLDAIDKHKLIVTVPGITQVWLERITDENDNVFTNSFVRVRNGAIASPFGSGSKMKIEGKIKPTFDIFFGQGTFFDTQPVIPTLANLSQAVSQAIGAIAQFVADAGGIVSRNPDHRTAS